nr:MAG TPA: hypothetical protein [Caudoviricetes sp.]
MGFRTRRMSPCLASSHGIMPNFHTIQSFIRA